MASGKKFVTQVLNELPDDSTVGDIVYELYVRHAIVEGEKAAAAGKVVPHEEAMREMAEWLRK